MKYKAVIFDLDGTLVDSIHGLQKAMNNVLERQSMPLHDTSSYKSFVGRGMRKLVRASLPKNSCEDGLVDRFLREMKAEYENCWNFKMKVYDGIEELIRKLNVFDILLAINTNKDQYFAKKIVDRYMAHWNIRELVGRTSETKIKPNPEGVLSIARNFGITARDILYVGDSEVDILTAKNAGADCVSVSWGFRSKLELRQASAQQIIDEPVELIVWVG